MVQELIHFAQGGKKKKNCKYATAFVTSESSKTRTVPTFSNRNELCIVSIKSCVVLINPLLQMQCLDGSARLVSELAATFSQVNHKNYFRAKNLSPNHSANKSSNHKFSKIYKISPNTTSYKTYTHKQQTQKFSKN